MESGAKEEGTLRDVTRASGHNWMVKVPFGEERRARRQASWGDRGDMTMSLVLDILTLRSL